MTDLLVFLLLPAPAIILWLSHRFPLLDKVGPAALCFLAGAGFGQFMEFGLGNTSFRTIAGEALGGFIALALPMLLFSSDIKAWFTLARRTMISMVLAMASVVCLASFLGTLFADKIDDLPYIASMAVGNFTGSLVNGAALKTALNASHGSFLLVYGYDVLISTLYLLLLITVAHRIAKAVLPPFQTASQQTPINNVDAEFDEYHQLLKLKTWRGLLQPLALNIVIIICAVFISKLFAESAQTAAAVVTLTLLSLTASMIRRIRTTKGTYPLGMYNILLFCTVSGSLFSSSLLEQATFTLFLFFLALAFGAVLLHMMLCRLLGIDADTFLVTSVAAILSPPFVPLAAGVMHNRTILLSGMSAGVLGYACGNLLGLATFWVIQHLT